MKSIEDKAHEILLKLIETDKTGFDAEGIAGYAYEIAEAMQAEAEKRKPKGEWQPDWSQAPEYCVMTDYHGGCYVYFNGELCVAHGVNNTPVALPKDSLRKRP